uniref:uncharacterized protein LOC120327877 n=1 Tax=Styela clava TaxID=7725 RepID=UPI00193A8D82|nr:uncharacterized protein LOC120327877 [Styela clava]
MVADTRSYASAAAQNVPENEAPWLDRSCDIRFKFQRQIKREEMWKFLEEIGANFDKIDGVVQYPNGVTEISFSNRLVALQMDRKIWQMEQEGKHLPAHKLMIPDKIPLYINWTPIRMTDNIILDYIEKNHGKPESIAHLKDRRGIRNGARRIIMKREDLANKPIKSYIFIRGCKLFVKYPGQIGTCSYCNEAGHMRFECPAKQEKSNKKTMNKADIGSRTEDQTNELNEPNREVPILEEDQAQHSSWAESVEKEEKENESNITSDDSVNITEIQNLENKPSRTGNAQDNQEVIARDHIRNENPSERPTQSAPKHDRQNKDGDRRTIGSAEDSESEDIEEDSLHTLEEMGNNKRKYDTSGSSVYLQETHSSAKEENKWTQEWGEKGAFWNSNNTKSSGVGILFKKTISPIFIDQKFDNKGRILVLNIVIQKIKIKLVNIYAYAQTHGTNLDKRMKFFSDVSEHLCTTTKVVLGGDFNVVVDPMNDKQPSDNHYSQAALQKHLKKLLNNFHLIDAFRHYARNKREFKYHHQNGNSRLDRIYTNDSKIIHSLYHISIPGTDHDTAVIQIQINLQEQRGPGLWRNNASHYDRTQFKQILEDKWKKWKTLQDYNNHNWIQWWKTTKTRIKQLLITFGAKERRIKKEETEKLQTEVVTECQIRNQGALISLDFLKAFDSIDHSFMFAVLKEYVTDPLLRTINRESNISGIKIQGIKQEIKTPAYADDITITAKNEISAKVALETVNFFGKASVSTEAPR